MIFEDFVLLGKTVPEPNSDGRIFVCSAGWSAEYRRLLRVYPMARQGSPRRWSQSVVRLERNPKDSRDESWRIAGERTGSAHNQINQNFKVVKDQVCRNSRPSLLKRAFQPSIKACNDQRMSLAIIQPKGTPRLFFEHNPESPNSPALRLFDVDDDRPEGAKRFAYIPRLEFEDRDGTHRLMLRDWGVYEFMRKHGESRRYEIADALRLGPDSSLLVGNLNHQRNAWLVISVLNGVADKAPTLFDDQEAA